MRKKIIIIIIIAIVAIALGITAHHFVAHRSDQTAQEWLDKQSEYVNNLTVYTDQMDDVFTLYFTGAISAEDFYVHLQTLYAEVDIMETDYQTYKESHPIVIGSQTYKTKLGTEAIGKCYGLLKEMLDKCAIDYDAPDLVLYEYLNYHQLIIEQLADYIVSQNMSTTPAYG